MEEDFYGSAYRGSRNANQKEPRARRASGFGGMIDDSMGHEFDLNEQLVINKPATFFLRMKGDAMTGAGINDGDLLIIDRSIKESNGKIIATAVDGELLVRRFQKTFNRVVLEPENKKYKSIEIGEFNTHMTWGVVTCVIHVLEPALNLI
ncbi:MAG TPA: translesion error-prone DNA polymerase V autoproteolytic subunit [Chitinophagaceae bacterium]|nr:translesion error-prone DNA polymerase V autoproteolytic subunit [Chitinophagaceae bacterium]